MFIRIRKLLKFLFMTHVTCDGEILIGTSLVCRKETNHEIIGKYELPNHRFFSCQFLERNNLVAVSVFWTSHFKLFHLFTFLCSWCNNNGSKARTSVHRKFDNLRIEHVWCLLYWNAKFCFNCWKRWSQPFNYCIHVNSKQEYREEETIAHFHVSA